MTTSRKQGKVFAISTSEKKGTRKTNVPSAQLKKNFGIVGDAHAHMGVRQVSLLASEAILQARQSGMNVQPGDFAENITTAGVDLAKLNLGERLFIGAQVELEISQIGKVCHTGCAVSKDAGKCIMPKQGIFAQVIRGGQIHVGDKIIFAARKN